MSPDLSRETRADTSGYDPQPEGATGALVLADGEVFWGKGVGATGAAVGEVCFNTSMTGYQEILTDPSYAAQIVTFTFPHIGNTGANQEDIESAAPFARGLVIGTDVTDPANWRSTSHFVHWLEAHNLIGLAGIDTRRLTRRIRDLGAPNGVIAHAPDGRFDLDALFATARAWPGLDGMDLALDVSEPAPARWDQTRWSMTGGHGQLDNPRFRVVAIDYGAKHNILRSLASTGCDVTVMPAGATASDILQHKPDGVFLSNGPGDPAATGAHAVPVIRALIESGIPIFGICLGHQLLALALGARTAKMDRGHRGANHPVKDLATGRVEITSQNHGFAVLPETLPDNVEVTHVSLFDGSNEGFRMRDKPVFAVQYHPEASPGPQDSHYLFHRFAEAMEKAAR